MAKVVIEVVGGDVCFGGLTLKTGLNEVDSKVLSKAAKSTPEGWLEGLAKAGRVSEPRKSNSRSGPPPGPPGDDDTGGDEDPAGDEDPPVE